ncbi:filamentous hemagglutinin N-terminal domain-containing protein [Candidatus Parabeggiatoa sp. HSG14]|uniref:two-partner secretion domain-containing protein n=1 Tax=Candidatus Parabeggiatoa sp. HSG14 TaxID=3055593 RepID=UPI0025A8C3CC|nr:filamentous hemagglutinin N-terminal domain-containing protein [Thiotrichales bacterium HSG14]
MKSKIFFTIVLLINTLSIHAEITTDGTLGHSGALPGPDYLIGADLGSHKGGNLFHSFQDFNLKNHESATFSGPNHVNNIISRVTGGNPSNIDGTIRSTIPNANMYFLNPYGIMFGPHAKLDVPGSFHASTADYLRLGEEGRFDARQPNNSILTVAPIEAFGFMSDSPAALSVEGSKLLTHPKTTISLVGGNLVIKGATLAIPNGQINLASAGSTGEVILVNNGLDTTTVNQFNDITITDNSLVKTSGWGAGDIYIQGGELLLQQSKINANAKKNGEKGEINIQVERLNILGNSQMGKMHQGKIVFDTVISSATISEGDGGDINIKASESFNLTNAAIFANSGELEIQRQEGGTHRPEHLEEVEYAEKPGNAGTISIETAQLTLDNAIIESNAFDSGQGGNIYFTVTGNTALSDSHIAVNAFEGSETGADRVGEISVVTKQLDLTNTIFSSSTFGSGTGGNIILKVNGSITLDHSAIFVDAHTSKSPPPPPDELIIKTTARNQSKPEHPIGDAGTILIEAEKVILTNRANISSNTSGTGNGGHITIYASDAITIQNPHNIEKTKNRKLSKDRFGIEAVSLSKEADSGHAGEIWLETQRLSLTNEADINTSSKGGGDAGHIYLTVNDFDMKHKSKIASSNWGKGNAGNIVIDAKNQIRLEHAKMTTEAASGEGGAITLNIGELVYLLNGKITTSVKGGAGNGGNITLEEPNIIAINHGQVKAQAFEGNGGNINISSNRFLASTDSLVSASSKLGISGIIEIDSPDTNMGELLAVLPGNFFDASTKIKKSCNIQQKNTFLVKHLNGSPPSPYDWKSNWLISLQSVDEKFSFHQVTPSLNLKNKNITVGQSDLKMASLTGCRLNLSLIDN